MWTNSVDIPVDFEEAGRDPSAIPGHPRRGGHSARTAQVWFQYLAQARPWRSPDDSADDTSVFSANSLDTAGRSGSQDSESFVTAASAAESDLSVVCVDSDSRISLSPVDSDCVQRDDFLLTGEELEVHMGYPGDYHDWGATWHTVSGSLELDSSAQSSQEIARPLPTHAQEVVGVRGSASLDAGLASRSWQCPGVSLTTVPWGGGRPRSEYGLGRVSGWLCCCA